MAESNKVKKTESNSLVVNRVAQSINKLIGRQDAVFMSYMIGKVDEDKLGKIACADYNNPIFILFISIFFGFIGVDRLMIKDHLGYIKMGMFILGCIFIACALSIYNKILLGESDSISSFQVLGRFGMIPLLISIIWSSIDIFFVYRKVQKNNLATMVEILKNED